MTRDQALYYAKQDIASAALHHQRMAMEWNVRLTRLYKALPEAEAELKNDTTRWFTDTWLHLGLTTRPARVLLLADFENECNNLSSEEIERLNKIAHPHYRIKL